MNCDNVTMMLIMMMIIIIIITMITTTMMMMILTIIITTTPMIIIKTNKIITIIITIMMMMMIKKKKAEKKKYQIKPDQVSMAKPQMSLMNHSKLTLRRFRIMGRGLKPATVTPLDKRCSTSTRDVADDEGDGDESSWLTSCASLPEPSADSASESADANRGEWFGQGSDRRNAGNGVGEDERTVASEETMF